MVGTTGLFNAHGTEPTLYSPLFARVLQQYNNRHPISLPDFGCRDTCDFELAAPGWDISCQTWTSPYQFMNDSEYLRLLNHVSPNEKGPIPGSMPTVFWSNVTFGFSANAMSQKLAHYRGDANVNDIGHRGRISHNSIVLGSMIKASRGINGTFAWRSCALQEAIQTYPVRATNSTISLRSMPLSKNFTQTKILRVPEMSSMTDSPSTNGGIWIALSQAFAGHARLQKSGPIDAVRTRTYDTWHNCHDLRLISIILTC
jgi:hypothetical protein